MKEPEKEHLQEEDEIRLLPAWKSALYILGGLAGLIIGGNFFVDGASGIAADWVSANPSSVSRS